MIRRITVQVLMLNPAAGMMPTRSTLIITTMTVERTVPIGWVNDKVVVTATASVAVVSSRGE
jgi:hypothetical protein